MKLAPKHSKLGIEGVVQGDSLYSKDDIKEERLNGVHISSDSNTIVYAILKNSDLLNNYLDLSGVVWHTSFEETLL